MNARDVHREDAEAVRVIAAAWWHESRLRKDLAQELVCRIRAETAAEIARHLDMIGDQDGRVLEEVAEETERTAEIEEAT